MSNWSLPRLLEKLHDDIERRLAIVREAFEHSGTKGDASEHVWLEFLEIYLPERLILLGEGSLRRGLRHYVDHFHEERNHQGKDNLLLFPLQTPAVPRKQEPVRCRERLGGLLKYYERKAA